MLSVLLQTSTELDKRKKRASKKRKKREKIWFNFFFLTSECNKVIHISFNLRFNGKNKIIFHQHSGKESRQSKNEQAIVYVQRANEKLIKIVKEVIDCAVLLCINLWNFSASEIERASERAGKSERWQSHECAKKYLRLILY